MPFCTSWPVGNVCRGGGVGNPGMVEGVCVRVKAMEAGGFHTEVRPRPTGPRCDVVTAGLSGLSWRGPFASVGKAV